MLTSFQKTLLKQAALALIVSSSLSMPLFAAEDSQSESDHLRTQLAKAHSENEELRTQLAKAHSENEELRTQIGKLTEERDHLLAGLNEIVSLCQPKGKKAE